MENPIIIESVKQPKRRRRQPASVHQIAVNRANAARSTGPRTPEGKASSSQNAIKHGLASSRFTVVRVEDPAQLQELRANLLHCYQPVNTQEIEAFDCMARAQLSMRRAAQLEASLFTTSINQALADPRIRMEPDLEKDMSISVDQNHGFYLAEGIRMFARIQRPVVDAALPGPRRAPVPPRARGIRAFEKAPPRNAKRTDKRDLVPIRTQTK